MTMAESKQVSVLPETVRKKLWVTQSHIEIVFLRVNKFSSIGPGASRKVGSRNER